MVEKLMERDYFLDAEQAVEMGLVDKVLTSREEQEKVMGPVTPKTEGNGNFNNGPESTSSEEPASEDPKNVGP